MSCLSWFLSVRNVMSTGHHRPFKGFRHAPLKREEPMISSEEKRALILAHHASRTTQRKKVPVAAYYIGVTASCLIVVSGWWITWGARLDSGLRPAADEAFTIVQTQYKQAKENLPTLPKKDDVKTLLEKAKQAVLEADAQQEALKNVAQKISQTSSTNP